jgi:hypothetical protein
MKFNAYIVQLKHREASLTGTLLIPGQPLSANFKKIGQNLFITQFKTQAAFSYLQEIKLKKRDKTITVLLPLLSKYNKRKLSKLAKLLDKNKNEGRNKYHILTNLPAIDKFLKMEELLDFFSIDRREMIDFLVEMELQKKIKVIDFNHLAVTGYENFLGCREQLNALFTESYTGQNQVIKFSDIESRIKLPQVSIFFKYLLHTFSSDFSFKIKKDRVVFRTRALSEQQEKSLAEISGILKKNKLAIFTLEDTLELSGLSHKEVNDTLWFLVERGDVIQLNERYFIFNDDLHKILNKLRKYKRNQGEMIDIQSFRELTLFSRKYIITLFEYFDSQHITMRVENQRKILLAA